MNKNKILTWALGIACLFGSPSCTNLDENVYDSITSDKFGQTDAEINSIMAAVYRTLRNVWPGDMFNLIEQTGDMAVTPTRIGGDWWDGGYHMELTRRNWTAMNNMVNSGWNACTDGIAACNRVYYILDKTEMDESLKNRYLSETRGVRAYWIYMMIDNFGNAPLVTDFSDTELPEMTSRKDLFNFVINELNEIKDNLPSEVNNATYGKFTQGAAYTLLAKMYLNAQEWIGKPMWKEAAAACDKVMSLGYIIEQDWKANFAVSNENSKEAIFALPYSKTVGGNFLDNKTLHYKDPIALGFTKGTWNGISAQPEYVRLFDEEDKRLEGSFLIGPMIDPSTGKVLVTDHGRELIHTIDFNMMSTEKYDGIWGEVQQEEGARCNKWTYESGSNNSDMENDFHIFRLADVYLMKAEALVRMGGDNAEATNLVNTIRARGFGNTDHNYTEVDLDKIYLERRLELAWELVSRQDMIRFGKFTEPGFLKPEPTPEYRKLFPVPYKAWQSNPKLKQNPGYPAF